MIITNNQNTGNTMSEHQATVEVFGASVANKVTAGGAVAGVAGVASQINWLGIAGVAIALLGFVVSFYFQLRRDRRESAESAARIKSLQAGNNDEK